jgi:hypothetical protein
MTLRIQCWSGPRNISTAFMYAWAQRADTTVVDEPLYASYLARHDRGHPMVDEVLASQSSDAGDVVENVVLGPCPTPILFVKQMAHHLRGLDTSFLAATENLLLTRDPADMLRSLSVQLPDCDLDDTGLPEQVDVLDAILGQGGEPVVVESRTLLEHPRGMLAAICTRLDVAFDPAMLSWPTGPKPYDGAWAPAWYANVHASTGFAPQTARRGPVPERLEPVLAVAQPLYDRLAEYAVGCG